MIHATTSYPARIGTLAIIAEKAKYKMINLPRGHRRYELVAIELTTNPAPARRPDIIPGLWAWGDRLNGSRQGEQALLQIA